MLIKHKWLVIIGLSLLSWSVVLGFIFGLINFPGTTILVTSFFITMAAVYSWWKESGVLLFITLSTWFLVIGYIIREVLTMVGV